jgi:predicted nucleic acid-binding protein
MLQAALDRRFRLLLSVPLLFEYEAVLKRPEHLAASMLSSSEVERVLDDLVSVAIAVGRASGRRLEMVDPNDVMVLETAVHGRADAIVTFNVRHFARTTTQPRIRIILPGEALREIGGSKRL